MSTRAQILAEITSLLPDNNTRAISPADLRTVVNALANSYNNSTDEGTPAAVAAAAVRAHDESASAHGASKPGLKRLALGAIGRRFTPQIPPEACDATGGTIAAMDTGGITLTRPVDGAGTYAFVKIPIRRDLSGGKYLEVELQGDANLAQIWFEFYAGASYTVAKTYDRIHTSIEGYVRAGERYRVVLPYSHFTGGTITAADVANFKAFGVRLYATAGTASVLKIHDLAVVQSAPPPGGMCIYFDDGYESVYTTAYPLMAARGQVGNFAVHSEKVGTAGYCTVAQLLELQAAGWSIVSHSINDTTQTEAAFRTASDWLKANGLTGYRHHVYVGGQLGSGIREAAMRVFTTARGVSSGDHLMLPLRMAHHIRGGAVTNATTLEQLKASFAADAINFGGVFAVTFHGVGDGPAGVAVTPELFGQYVEWLYVNGVKTYSVEALYDAESALCVAAQEE